MSHRTIAVLWTVLALAMVGWPVMAHSQQAQTEEMNRRVKTRVEPRYPDLARKMHIAGTVKVEVVVEPNGAIKQVRLVGGHPVLAAAALDAAKMWRFEPAETQSTGVVEFKFEPRQ